MKKIIFFSCLLLLGIFCIGVLGGLHFKEINAIPGDVNIVQSQDISDYGRAILFEDNRNQTFGIAELKKKFGILYRYAGGTSGSWIAEDKPFEATGVGDPNNFLVAVKTARESNIKYIALGNHLDDVSPSESYELTLEDVKANREEYELKEVINNYVLFVFDEYTEDTWTIRAFDEQGKLVADKLVGGKPRYIDWE